VIDPKAFRAMLRIELDKCDPKKDTPDLSGLLSSVQNIVCEEAVRFTYGNQAKAARMLDVNRGTFRVRLHKARRANE